LPHYLVKFKRSTVCLICAEDRKQHRAFRLREILISGVNTMCVNCELENEQKQQFIKFSVTFWVTHSDPHNLTWPDPTRPNK